MAEQTFVITDWMRILFGNVPLDFYLETLVRIVFIYLLIVGSMRLMGNRMSSTFNQNELAAMVVLAAGSGVPIQSPDRGLIPALIIASIVVFVERGIAALAYRNATFERRTQGKISTLVRDAVMDVREMKKARISRERVMSQLRSKEVYHLGQVRRLYLEAGGDFALSLVGEPSPGLSCVPEWDTDLIAADSITDIQVCKNCGCPKGGNPKCTNCHEEVWVAAIR